MVIYQNLWLKVSPETQIQLGINDGQEVESLEQFISIIDFVLSNDFSVEMGEI